MTEEIDYQLIKKWLPYGEVTTLANEFKISRNQAYKILKGNHKNFDFLEIAMNRAIENANKFRTLQEKLKAL